MQKRLAEIATAEGAHIDKDALRMLALLAEGSERDAESLLGQTLASHAGSMSGEDVAALLGSQNTSRSLKTCAWLAKGRARNSRARNRAFDPQHHKIPGRSNMLCFCGDNGYRAALNISEHCSFKTRRSCRIEELRRMLVPSRGVSSPIHCHCRASWSCAVNHTRRPRKEINLNNRTVHR